MYFWNVQPFIFRMDYKLWLLVHNNNVKYLHYVTHCHPLWPERVFCVGKILIEISGDMMLHLKWALWLIMHPSTMQGFT